MFRVRTSLHQAAQAACVFTCLLAAACGGTASTSDSTTLQSLTRAAAPGDDAPELAHLGPFRVGVQSLEFEYENAPDVSALAHLSGTVPEWTRRLSVDVLYPADIPAEQPADAVYTATFQTGLTQVQGLPESFRIEGLAVRCTRAERPEISARTGITRLVKRTRDA